jgi:TatD DNase family protein
MSFPLYDAHNHLHDAWLSPHRSQIFDDLAAVNVRHAIVNGTSESDWPDVSALAHEFPLVLPSYGLHPWDVGNRSPDWQKNLLSALGLAAVSETPKPNLQSPNLTAKPAKVGLPTVGSAKVGEFGLDRWILDRARPDDPRLTGLRRAPLPEQTEVFLWQLELAATHNLPASIHCLDAWGHLHDLLRSAPRPARGFLLHAYSGPAEMVKPFADLGAFFSFNGSFLDPRKTRLRELYAALPTDRLLVETDAPAMRLPATDEKYPPLSTSDGSVANHPANLAATYQALAVLRRTPIAELAAQVEQNFRRLFL